MRDFIEAIRLVLAIEDPVGCAGRVDVRGASLAQAAAFSWTNLRI
jgi:hypothetical protein